VAHSQSTALSPHSREHPCLICGGHPGLRRGRGERCAGFVLDRVAYCTREEYAGRLMIEVTTSPPAFKHQLFGSCDCGQTHGWRAVARHAPPAVVLSAAAPAPREIVSGEDRDRVYRDALALLPLRPAAIADLTRRGLDDGAIEAAGYRSIPHRGEENQGVIRELVARHGEELVRAVPGFTNKNGVLTMWNASPPRDGYIIPHIDVDGRITGLQARFFNGRYLTAAGTQLASVHHLVGLPRAGQDLYVTEGATKANVAAALGGLSVFAVAGQSLQPSHIEAIVALQPGRVIIALDQEDNENTARARARWVDGLIAADLQVYEAVWEGSDVGGPKGLDDLIAAEGRPRLRPVTRPPPDFNQPRRPRWVPERGPIALGGTLAEARQTTQRAIADFIQRRPRGEALIVATPPGAGKTTAVASALERNRFGVRVLVGTEALAMEIAERSDFIAVRGRNGDNCARFDVVHALGEAGHPLEALACGSEQEPRCPHRSECVYLAQFDAPGVWIGATEQLFNRRFLKHSGLIIIDDGDLDRALVERVRVVASSIATAAKHPVQRRGAVRALLRVLQHAFIDLDGPLTGGRAWDHLARTAARQGEDLAALVRALPQRPTLPKPVSKGPLEVDDVALVPPRTLLHLFAALLEELPAFLSGEPFNSHLRLDADGIDVWALRAHVSPARGVPDVADMAILALDATPVEPLLAHLTALHRRQPDVRAPVRLPGNVRVVQHASASRGHVAVRSEGARREVLSEVAREREDHPVMEPEHEAVVSFLSLESDLIALGFASTQVLHFRSARGTNAVATVERLHLVGRPMPPSPDLHYLAQVIHHAEAWVSDALVLQARPYGGKPFEVDVADFADPRLAALLRAQREDEMTQVIHRARLFDLEPQAQLLPPQSAIRIGVRLVLHTSHPIPGLRVDELHFPSVPRSLNDRRQEEAEDRIVAAVERLHARGEESTQTAVAKEAGANKKTVAKVLGTPVHTPTRDLLNRGVHRVPQMTSERTGA
jgi:hypothetical protein